MMRHQFHPTFCSKGEITHEARPLRRRRPEKPGIIDNNGKIRDLSKIVKDIDGEALSPAGLAKIKKANIDKLPLVKGNPRLGPCVARPRTSSRSA